MRSFIGIPLSGELLISTKVLMKDLKTNTVLKKIRWIPSPNWHMTLRFLGNASDEQIAQLREQLATIANNLEPFEIESNGMLTIPHKRPRILALSIRLNNPLATLVHDLNEVSDGCGFEPDKRPFLPHITLGKWKHPLHESPEIALKHFASQQVTAFHLYKSEQTETGSVYTPIETFRLD